MVLDDLMIISLLFIVAKCLSNLSSSERWTSPWSKPIAHLGQCAKDIAALRLLV